MTDAKLRRVLLVVWLVPTVPMAIGLLAFPFLYFSGRLTGLHAGESLVPSMLAWFVALSLACRLPSYFSARRRPGGDAERAGEREQR